MKLVRKFILVFLLAFAVINTIACSTADLIEPEVVDKKFEKKKTDAIELVEGLLKENLYREAEINTIKSAIESAKKDIGKAKIESQINKAIDDCKQAIADCRLKADYEKVENFSNYKNAAKSLVENKFNKNDYRENEEFLLITYINQTKTLIVKAINEAEIDEAVNLFEQNVSKLKTKFVYEEEEKFVLFKNNAIKTVENIVNLNNYYLTEKYIIQSEISKAKEKINNGLNESEINSVIQEFKIFLATIKTIKDYETIALLNDYKEKKIKEISEYKDLDNYEENNLLILITKLNFAIENITNSDSIEKIDALVHIIKIELDSIKTKTS